MIGFTCWTTPEEEKTGTQYLFLQRHTGNKWMTQGWLSDSKSYSFLLPIIIPWWERFTTSKENCSSVATISKRTSVVPKWGAGLAATTVRRKTMSVGQIGLKFLLVWYRGKTTECNQLLKSDVYATIRQFLCGLKYAIESHVLWQVGGWK